MRLCVFVCSCKMCKVIFSLPLSAQQHLRLHTECLEGNPPLACLSGAKSSTTCVPHVLDHPPPACLKRLIIHWLPASCARSSIVCMPYALHHPPLVYLMCSIICHLCALCALSFILCTSCTISSTACVPHARDHPQLVCLMHEIIHRLRASCTKSSTACVPHARDHPPLACLMHEIIHSLCASCAGLTACPSCRQHVLIPAHLRFCCHQLLHSFDQVCTNTSTDWRACE